MTNFEHLLELDQNSMSYFSNMPGVRSELKSELSLRLKRLICGYHATQRFFNPLVTPNSCVADVGCYYGQWSYPLLDLAKEVYFIDYLIKGDKWIKRNTFDYLSKLLSETKEGNATYINHNFAQRRLPSKKFDVIICLDMLYVIQRRWGLDTFFLNLVDALNDGG